MITFKITKCLLTICFSSFFLLPSLQAQTITFDDSGPDVMILRNSAYYEIGISKSNGAITYIKDNVTNTKICLGSPFGVMFWGIGLTDGNNLYSNSPENRFSYQWTAGTNILTMQYTQAQSESLQIPVIIKIFASTESYFDMQMTATNNSSSTIKSFGFPLGLLFSFGSHDKAVVPCDYPGMVLQPRFFSEKRSFNQTYPGNMRADFVGIQIGTSKFSIYSLRDGMAVRPTGIGFNYDSDNTYSYYRNYPAWLTKGNTWTCPITRIRITPSIIESAKNYRIDNNLGSFPSLKTKLGSKYQEVISSPLIDITFGENVHLHFKELPGLMKKLPSPSILFLKCYWGSWYKYHPEYIPPDPTLGTTEEFSQMFTDIQKLGHLMMPFTFACFWHKDSPILKNLPYPLTIKDIAQIKDNGEPWFFAWDKDGEGYFVSPYNQFVKQRISQMMTEMTQTVHSDLIYEDVLAARDVDYDFNESSPTPMDVGEGWLEHTRKYSSNLLVEEKGYDRMSETVSGFLGTSLNMSVIDQNSVWTMVWDSAFGAGNWDYYPVIPFLYNDKALNYPYWWVYEENNQYLTWNLLYGSMLDYSPSAVDLSRLLENSTPPYLKVISDFQHEVTSRIAGKLMTNYTEISSKVKQSTFEDIVVTGNQDSINSYTSGKYVISPDGALVTSSTGDLIAGIFKKFNSKSLSTGDHYLIVNNDKDSITIRQPMGPDTDLTIDRPGTWTDISKIKVYTIGKSNISEVPKTLTDNSILFKWQRILSKDTVGYYIITNNKAKLALENISICSGQSYNGWTIDGTFKRTLKTKSGADSIVTTNLTVHPVFNTSEDRTICYGQNYYGWTTSGTYSRTLQSQFGCDSIVTTNLTVNPVYNSNDCRPVSVTAYFKSSQSDTLVIGNKTYYEIGINKSFGGILYIKDKITGENVSLGSPFGSMLWGVKLKDGTNIWSTSPQNPMSYEWSANTNTLILRYIPTGTDPKKMEVSVNIALSDEPYFDMQMSISNNVGQECESVLFPLELLFLMNKDDNAVFDFGYPGVRLNSKFFAEKRSYNSGYPGLFKSDFVSLKIKNSSIALYTLRDNLPVQYSWLGINQSPDLPKYPDRYSLRHEYPVWIKNGTSWITPVSRINLSGNIKETIKDLREASNFASFPSLQTKLGPLYNSVLKSPYYYQDFGSTTNLGFNDFPKLTARIPGPSLLMLVSFWQGNFFKYHPDTYTPDPGKGTKEEFLKMIDNVHKQGHLVMPFTNPVWWHENSPTLKNLSSPLTINNIARLNKEGIPVRQDWNFDNEVEWGYYVSPSQPFVKEKLATIMQELKTTYHNDFIWEDGVGALAWDYDFNTSASNPTSFNNEWLQHTKDYKNNLLVVESGYDRMAETAVGFMGTAFRASTQNGWSFDSEFGTGNWDIYPTGPYLYNDKVLRYQFWWNDTKDKATLSWNMLYGSMLNYTDFDKTLENNTIPWLDVISGYQQFVVSRIAGKLMTNYTDISDKVKQSTFGDIIITSNQDASSSNISGKYVLSPDGTLVTSTNGDLIAGIFLKYNNGDLSVGDHYLIVNNYKDSITVRHPMGADTELTVEKPGTWTDNSKIKVYTVSKTKILEAPKSFNDNGVHFKWQRIVSSDTAAYYLVTYNLNAPPGAGVISGTSPVCKGQNSVIYTTPPITNATSYIWTLPAGTTGTSSTNSITVNYGISAVSGNITVKGRNTWGDGAESSLAITVNQIPTGGGTITGPLNVCPAQNSVIYTIPTISTATSYIWTMPTGATGTSTTNSITVNYGTSAASGNITVKGHNDCGDGAASSLAVTVNPKPVTPVVTTNLNILHSNAPNGNQWYNNNSLITGATSQDYTFSSVGNYTVVVTLNGCASDTSITSIITGTEQLDYGKKIIVYPNPVSGDLTIKFSNNHEEVKFKIVNIIGQVIYDGRLIDKTVVNTTSFTPGLYLIKFEVGPSYEFRKVIKNQN